MNVQRARPSIRLRALLALVATGACSAEDTHRVPSESAARTRTEARTAGGRTRSSAAGFAGVGWSIAPATDDATARRWPGRAEVEKQELHEQLVAASRQAGMAEVATSVLHNVGNVLNSVNVSITLVSDRLVESRMSALVKAAALFREDQANLAAFLVSDERGRRLPSYLEKLGASLEEERRSILNELGSVTRDIDHIKHVVQSQQSYA